MESFKWEEGNPLEIEKKDRSIFITHIQGVHRKADIRLRYYSEIWCVILCISLILLFLYGLARLRFMATWTNSIGKYDEAMSILKAGMEAKSLILCL
jgi:cleavage stimulation factor subunit 3